MAKPEMRKSAVFCPVRIGADDAEILLVRRAYWNYKENRPERHPGEWAVCGGGMKESDANLETTAIREFQEETGYSSQIYKMQHMMTARFVNPPPLNRIYHVKYYIAKIDDAVEMVLPEKGELIDTGWFTPQDAITLLYSREFVAELMAKYEILDLGNPKYGKNARTEREMPLQPIQPLTEMLRYPDKIRNFLQQ